MVPQRISKEAFVPQGIWCTKSTTGTKENTIERLHRDAETEMGVHVHVYIVYTFVLILFYIFYFSYWFIKTHSNIAATSCIEFKIQRFINKNRNTKNYRKTIKNCNLLLYIKKANWLVPVTKLDKTNNIARQVTLKEQDERMGTKGIRSE